jgi:hypothetical protein
VRSTNGMEVASEVKVDVFHRNYLGETATSSATLHAKARSKGWFAQANNGLLANGIKTIA